MNNQRIAARFLEIAERLERLKDNPYRIRAYRRAASVLNRVKEDVSTLSRQERLTNIPGIGQELADKIIQFLESGEIPDPPIKQEFPDTGTTELPQGFLDLIMLGALNQKSASILHHHFYIDSLEDLERLTRSHLLRTLPSFGARLERKILSGLETLRNQRNA